MFNKVVNKYKVVEVRPNDKLPELGQELRESILTLPYHPGFDYIIKKFRMQRALLEHKLKNERFSSISDVEFLQSGIYWLDWLDNQIRFLTKIPAPPPRDINEAEKEVFDALAANIHEVL